MAWGDAPAQLATQTSQTSGHTSATLNIGTPSAGQTVIVSCYANGGYPTSVVDTDGNNYVQDAADNRGGDAFNSIWRFHYASAPSGAQTVTITIPSSNISFNRAWSIDGAASAPFDKAGTNNGFSTTPSVTATGANDSADVYVFCFLGMASGDGELPTTWPPTTGYTTLGTQRNQTRNDSIAYAYKVVSSGETSSATSAYAASAVWAFTLATYKKAAGATAYEIDAQPGTFALTGAAATPAAGRMINAAPGSLNLTGAAATVPAGRVVSADPGTFNVAGADASPVADRTVNAEPGTYGLTGANAGLPADRTLAADPAAYAVTGETAGLLADRTLPADPGTFTLTGVSAELVYQPLAGAFSLDAEPGAFALTGQSAGTVADRSLDAAPAVYALTGSQAGLGAGRMVAADPGAYTVDGAQAAPVAARMILAAPGAYTVTGANATLTATSGDPADPPITSRTRSAVRSGLTASAAASGRTLTRVASGETTTVGS